MAKKKTTKKRSRPQISKKAQAATDQDNASADKGTAAGRAMAETPRSNPPLDEQQGDYDDLRESLRFSKEAIDDALIEQPVLFERVSAWMASAINRRDLVREEQKRVEARLADEIREESETKLTVKEVEAAVEQHADYIDARERYKAASYWVDKWDGLKDSFRQRSAALRDLTQLHVTGHYQVGTRSYEDVRSEMAAKRNSE